MKFLITRLSEFDDNVKPCEGAYQETIGIRSIRLVGIGSEENLKNWYATGHDHYTSEDGKTLFKIVDRKHWIIELNSLEELQEFIKREGDIIIEPKFYESPEWTMIKIYDYYNE